MFIVREMVSTVEILAKNVKLINKKIEVNNEEV